MKNKIELVKKQVSNLLELEDSGHDIEHVNRVLELSLKFAAIELANKDIVTLIALLHDVDDYKLFDEENAKNLTNAKRIMNDCKIPIEVQNNVVSSLEKLGYSNYLKCIRPETIEGQVVSDADMCDALGVNGVLRIYKYSLKKGKPFFNKNIFPLENITVDLYKKNTANSSVCHMFEKILKLKKIMMTESGKKESEKRHQIIVDVLYQLFEEEKANDWKRYLDDFLKENYSSE